MVPINRDFKEMQALCTELSQTDDPVEAKAFRDLAANYDTVLSPNPPKPFSFSTWLVQVFVLVAGITLAVAGAALLLPQSTKQTDDGGLFTKLVCTGAIANRPAASDAERCKEYRSSASTSAAP